MKAWQYHHPARVLAYSGPFVGRYFIENGAAGFIE
jgi:hypothetical protein